MLFSLIFVSAILRGEKRSLIVLLSCIFLMTTGAKHLRVVTNHMWILGETSFCLSPIFPLGGLVAVFYRFWILDGLGDFNLPTGNSRACQDQNLWGWIIVRSDPPRVLAVPGFAP